MAKGYWVASIDVTDMDGYKAYVAANAEPSAANSARRFLTRGGKSEAVEGKLRSRDVVIEFPELRGGARLLPLAGIPEGQGAAHRHSGVGDIVVIEGYDGPQP